MDWGKAKDKIHFAFMRAGIGNNTIDPTFVFNRSECIKRDIAWSLYWYLKPSKSALTTAESFANIAKDIQYKKIPVWADIEDNEGLDKSTLANWMTKFYKRFNEVAPEIKLGFYTSPGFANAYFWGTEFQDLMKMGSLWDACWTNNNEPAVPYVWSKIRNPKTWDFWQWRSKGIGSDYGASSTNIDENRYHYTLGTFNSEYDAHIIPLPIPEPPPTPLPEIPEKIIITVDSLNIRNSTLVSNDTIIGQTYRNKVWYPDGIEKDSNGKYWYYFGSKKKIYIASWYTKKV